MPGKPDVIDEEGGGGTGGVVEKGTMGLVVH